MTVKKTFIVAIVALSALLLAACSSSATPEEAESQELTDVKLYLSFIPNVQFAPFYVAIENGHFEENGLNVEIEHISESDALRLISTEDETAMAVVSGEQVLLARQQDLPVVYVYEWYQRFPIAIAAQQGTGVASFADLAGKTVGVPIPEGASYIGLQAALFSAGLTDADITLEVTNFQQVTALATNQVEAAVVYIANEPIQLEAQGIAVDVLAISEQADLVANGIVASEDLLANNPELVTAFNAAFDDALQYTIDNSDEAFEISKTFVEGLDENEDTAATQREVLARSIDLWDGERLGLTEAASWEAMQDVLLEMELLTAEQDLSAAYTNDYLPE